MKLDLKKFLKKLKLNEDKISMVLGIIVVFIVGNFIVNYIKAKRVDDLPALQSDANQEESVHKVTKGESLWVIAENYYGSGYNWVDLAKANSLENYSLEVGQELKIPAVSNVESLKPTVAEAKTYAQADNTIASDTYTVEKGDTLWSIAVRTYGDGYQWVKLANANNLEHPNLIHSGNVLTLPR